MPQLYESRVGQTRYTAEHDTKSKVPPFVKLTRYNRDGKTEIFFPTDLLWNMMFDRFRERIHKRLDHLLFKDLNP